MEGFERTAYEPLLARLKGLLDIPLGTRLAAGVVEFDAHRLPLRSLIDHHDDRVHQRSALLEGFRRQVPGLPAVLVHELLELQGLLVLPELGARAHDRHHAAAGLEEIPGVPDVVDVLLLGEGRIHDDPVVALLLELHEVLADEPIALFLEVLLVSFLDLDKFELAVRTGCADYVGDRAAAGGRLEDLHPGTKLGDLDQHLGHEPRSHESLRPLLDVHRLPGGERLGDLFSGVSLEDVTALAPVPFPAQGLEHLVDGDVEIPGELLVDLEDVARNLGVRENALHFRRYIDLPDLQHPCSLTIQFFCAATKAPRSGTPKNTAPFRLYSHQTFQSLAKSVSFSG